MCLVRCIVCTFIHGVWIPAIHHWSDEAKLKVSKVFSFNYKINEAKFIRNFNAILYAAQIYNFAFTPYENGVGCCYGIFLPVCLLFHWAAWKVFIHFRLSLAAAVYIRLDDESDRYARTLNCSPRHYIIHFTPHAIASIFLLTHLLFCHHSACCSPSRRRGANWRN